jgi:hypothetical protein
MPFDKVKFAKHLTDHALSGFGVGRCARYVREALVAGGLNTQGNPLSAKDYGPFLVRLGFAAVVTTPTYVPQQGDIVVMPGNRQSIHGHIAGYTGTQWISDFKQRDMYGGQAFRTAGTFTIYRHP